MTQSHALLTFLLLVIPSINDHVQLDEVVVLAFWYQNSSKLIYIRTINTLVLNPFLLKFQIILSPLISSVFIALQDTDFFEEFQDLLENVATIHSCNF